MESIRYRLTVEPNDTKTKVNFRLEPSGGRYIPAHAPYPEVVERCYGEWKHHYLRFYQAGLRAKVVSSGVLTDPPEELKRKLDEAELQLCDVFEEWLSFHRLQEIKHELTKAIQEVQLLRNQDKGLEAYVEVCLICTSIELERLPWEAWRLLSDPTVRHFIRISRAPEKIQSNCAAPREEFRRGKARMLIILGDGKQINVEKDLAILKNLASMLEMETVICTKAEDPLVLRRRISEALLDAKGWDVLMFAGHSNETAMTGGEILIAEGHTLTISDIKDDLTFAKQRGLQFAFFNSCRGLSIAQSLIGLGLNQVGVMREAVHDAVALEFIKIFVKGLSQHRDVHDALREACWDLKSRLKGSYPSAYLVPLLFRNPQAELFRIEPMGLKPLIRSLRPSRWEWAIAGGFALLSMLLPGGMIWQDTRQHLQSQYRQAVLKSLPPPPETAPILLVELQQPRPVNRTYLAETITALSEQGAKLFGIDFLLYDRDVKGDAVLVQSIQGAEKRHAPGEVCFVFAVKPQSPENIQISQQEWRKPAPEIERSNAVVLGSTVAFANPFYMSTPIDAGWKINGFSERLATLYHQSVAIRSRGENQEKNCQGSSLAWPPPMTRWLAPLSHPLKQMWFYPMVDYSVPPQSIYQIVTASQIHSDYQSAGKSEKYRNRVIVLSSGHPSAGDRTEGEDYFDLPSAVDFWRKSVNASKDRGLKFTGSELLAYQFQSFLSRRFVWAIPDLWMVGLAVFVGKLVSLKVRRSKKSLALLLGMSAIVGVGYVFACLYIYFSTLILVPILLPLGTGGAYFMAGLLNRRKGRA